jgi:membrane protein
MVIPAKRPRWVLFLNHVVRRYWHDEALNLASSLSFTALLSMVPLLAIGLALLAAFPGFDALRRDLLEALFRDLVPDVGAQVQHYVGRFASNAEKLRWAGIAGLVVTAVMMLASIETALNRIFQVPQRRAAWRRIAIYWSALCLGPLLAGAALTMSAWFSLLPFVRSMHSWAGRAATAEVRAVVAVLLPFLIMSVAFALLFIVAPARRVRLADAAIGGATAALLVLALRAGFGLYVALWGGFRPIYGAISAVPIFLAWIYFSWTAVLFGAEMAASLPELRRGRLEAAGPIAPRRRLALALSMLVTLRDHDGPGLDNEALARAAGEAEMPTVAVLRRLVAAGLVVPRGRGRFGPGDLAQATFADLVGALELGLRPIEDGSDRSPLPPSVEALVAAAGRAESEALRLPIGNLLGAA